MSELTFNLLRLGYLLLLWVFVLSAVAVLRRDISVRGQAAARSGELRSREAAIVQSPGTMMEQPPPNPWVSPSDAMPLPPEPVVSPPLPVPAPGPVVVVGPGTSAQAAPEPIVVGSKQPKYLAITSGALAGSMLPLTSLPITIGRAPSNTLVIEDDYASSHHARLYPTAEGWVVEDLNSTNGTLVNGAPLTGAVLLPVGVPVSIGHSQVKLVV